jgi:catechol 2,3-dioxygenase-like lactoylglutathione lyase family enzyme
MPENNWLIDHTGIGVLDIHRSARFYEAALGALGARPLLRITQKREPMKDEGPDLGGVAYGVDQPVFWIDVFHPHGVKQHTAFRAQSRSQVDAFHAAALRAGGTDNGEPGLRTGSYPAGYYAAFVIDPDGNNIEAVFREK